jgi:hypothetical protein
MLFSLEVQSTVKTLDKDKVGFEPTVSVNTIVFKTNALNPSTTYPKANKGI